MIDSSDLREDRTGTSVLLVDDQELIRRSLRIVIDREHDLVVVGEAESGEQAKQAARTLQPDVVLMDIRMPGGDGIQATADITSAPGLNATRVVVLTMHELDEYVYGALQAGASGFLLKDAHPTDLVDAIRRTNRGESLFAPTILTSLINRYLERPAPSALRGEISTLTHREVEILTLIGRGLSNDEIEVGLSVSRNTVKTHISRLISKLAVRDRAQLVIAAYEHGLVGGT